MERHKKHKKHTIGLMIWYTLDQTLPSYLQIAADFERDLCRRVEEAGMEQYRALSPNGPFLLPDNRLRVEFLIVAGVEAASRQDAAAKALTLLHQVKAEEAPEGIGHMDIALATNAE